MAAPGRRIGRSISKRGGRIYRATILCLKTYLICLMVTQPKIRISDSWSDQSLMFLHRVKNSFVLSIIAVCAFVLAGICARQAFAHHSFAMYDQTKVVVLT